MPSTSSGIAVLVLAHKQAPQVQRLANHLGQEFDVFIHLDNRSRLETSDFHKLSRTVTIKRHKTAWGSPGIVYAMLDLLKLAFRTSDYQHFVFISGEDVPLKSNAAINEFFSQSRGVDFIESHPFSPEDSSRLTRVSRFHLFRLKNSAGGRRRWASGANPFIAKLLSSLGVNRSMDYEFRWGSQWMDLSRETVARLLGFLGSQPAFLRRFRFTFCADEIFFQTAIQESGSLQPIKPPHRFIDWETGPEHPRVLRIDDLARLTKSDALFARKVDAGVDKSLLNALYERITR